MYAPFTSVPPRNFVSVPTKLVCPPPFWPKRTWGHLFHPYLYSSELACWGAVPVWQPLSHYCICSLGVQLQPAALVHSSYILLLEPRMPSRMPPKNSVVSPPPRSSSSMRQQWPSKNSIVCRACVCSRASTSTRSNTLYTITMALKCSKHSSNGQSFKPLHSLCQLAPDSIPAAWASRCWP